MDGSLSDQYIHKHRNVRNVRMSLHLGSKPKENYLDPGLVPSNFSARREYTRSWHGISPLSALLQVLYATAGTLVD